MLVKLLHPRGWKYEIFIAFTREISIFGARMNSKSTEVWGFGFTGGKNHAPLRRGRAHNDLGNLQ